MQLFIKDEQGKYITATTPEIIKEGRSRTRSTLKKDQNLSEVHKRQRKQ